MIPTTKPIRRRSIFHFCTATKNSNLCPPPAVSPANKMAKELSQEIELMTRVASMYYLEDVTQGEIAAQLGLSRPKVGRLLKRAKQEGIVEITVHTHPALSMRLENALQARFGLRQALLV